MWQRHVFFYSPTKNKSILKPSKDLHGSAAHGGGAPQLIAELCDFSQLAGNFFQYTDLN